MSKETIVMYDSPEAASIQTVTGWVSRRGHFWRDDEHMARYDGSTHKRCECGEIVPQRSWCKTCHERLRPMTADRLRHRRARPVSGRLCCSDCGAPIHRHDRYTIVKARHKSCSDPKLVGQKSLEIA